MALSTDSAVALPSAAHRLDEVCAAKLPLTLQTVLSDATQRLSPCVLTGEAREVSQLDCPRALGPERACCKTVCTRPEQSYLPPGGVASAAVPVFTMMLRPMSPLHARSPVNW